jgi:hypothetical protein
MKWASLFLRLLEAFCLLKDRCILSIVLYSNGIACAPKNVAFMDMGYLVTFVL